MKEDLERTCCWLDRKQEQMNTDAKMLNWPLVFETDRMVKTQSGALRRIAGRTSRMHQLKTEVQDISESSVPAAVGRKVDMPSGPVGRAARERSTGRRRSSSSAAAGGEIHRIALRQVKSISGSLILCHPTSEDLTVRNSDTREFVPAGMKRT